VPFAHHADDGNRFGSSGRSQISDGNIACSHVRSGVGSALWDPAWDPTPRVWDPGWSDSPLKMKSTQPAEGCGGMTHLEIDVRMEEAAIYD
jgi:hypothetical protein